jgi:hypothetical protein
LSKEGKEKRKIVNSIEIYLCKQRTRQYVLKADDNGRGGRERGRVSNRGVELTEVRYIHSWIH